MQASAPSASRICRIAKLMFWSLGTTLPGQRRRRISSRVTISPALSTRKTRVARAGTVERSCVGPDVASRFRDRECGNRTGRLLFPPCGSYLVGGSRDRPSLLVDPPALNWGDRWRKTSDLYKNSGEILNRTHNYRDRLLGELWAVIGRCAVEDWLLGTQAAPVWEAGASTPPTDDC